MSHIFESMTGLALMDPWLLLLLTVIPLAWWVQRRRSEPALRFAPAMFLHVDPSESTDAAHPQGGAHSWRVRLLPLPRVLQILGLVMVILALARPVQRDPMPLHREGIDILLCLDRSSSMAARDLDPQLSRIDVAKKAAREFISGRPDDRIGLLTFARYPDLRCPLTRDHGALEESIDSVTLVGSDSPEDATGIGTAVARAAQVFSTSGPAPAAGADGRSQVIILLTDGVENVATSETPDEIAPLHAAQLCKDLGLRVHVIAAGVDGTTVMGAEPRPGNNQIRSLAIKTGGRFHAARDAAALVGVYTAIDSLEKIEMEDPLFQMKERFLLFLITASALLIAGFLLEATVFEVLP